MKKRHCFFGILFFYLFCLVVNVFCCNTDLAWAEKSEQSTANVVCEFVWNGLVKEIDFESLKKQVNYSKNTEKLTKNEKLKMIDTVKNMGFTEEDAITYVFPEAKIIYEMLSKQFNIKAEDDYLEMIPGSCDLKVKSGRRGLFLNRDEFFKLFYDCLKKSDFIKFELPMEPYESGEKLKDRVFQKSCFSTNFSTSSEQRKNNIKRALAAFDGVVLEPGEVLSFNRTTGERTRESGYQEAKIISGGTFTSGFGGGVCQVSTTLFNACLLADLEILEANSHSLPVSYVEPSFDAMVNSGSSDLLVRNNTGEKIVFTTSSDSDICKVKIFGKKNKYKITRISEKVKILPAGKERVETDYLKFGLPNLEIGEEKRVSYSKEGFVSNGYLNYYDSKGTLVKTKKFRTNTYKPTDGVVVKREK